MAEPMTIGLGTYIAIKAVSYVGMGACLALGFYATKCLTNRIDRYVFEHSQEYQDLLNKHRTPKTEQASVASCHAQPEGIPI